MGFVDELAAVLPDNAVIIDRDQLEKYRYDETNGIAAGHPVAAAFPTTTDHVSRAVQVAAAHKVPVLPRGAGTSHAGGATAIDGCLVLGLERMNRLLEVDPVDQTATVDPGVFNADITVASRDDGLFYPPDPSSKAFCTIGGNVATNAGGLCCVKYGVTRDSVLGLEVVLADGSVIETGRRTVKGVAGLDMTSLFVGSEGTLGVVTRVRVRLRPAPEGAATTVAVFPTLGTAGEAVAAIVRSGLQLSLIELMDHGAIVAVDSWRNLGLDRTAAALLFLQSDNPEPLRTREIERATEICELAGATYTAATSDPVEAEALLQARRLVGSAVDTLPGLAIHEDVVVPRSKLPALIGRLEAIAERYGVRLATSAHAGDGNLHPTLITDDDEDGRARVAAAFDAVIDATLDLGGTISGEHGIGAIKGRFLEREVGSRNLAAQRQIKRALDPDGLFVPGRWL